VGIDNVIVKLFDPLQIGLAEISQSACVIKTVAKVS